MLGNQRLHAADLRFTHRDINGVTRGTAAKARKLWTRIGRPCKARNCLGAFGVAWPGAMRVPMPAAGRITKTRINLGV
jgi:hypothetical protein